MRYQIADKILMDRIFDNAQDVFNTALSNGVFNEETAANIMYMHSCGHESHYFKHINTRQYYLAIFCFFGPYYSTNNK